MSSAQRQLDVVTHNLANAATAGYKRDGVVFNDTLSQALYGADGRFVGNLGAGSTLIAQFTNLAVGSIMTTGNVLDVAIQTQQGFFAVEAPTGVRYTRDGSFTLNADRELTTKTGLPVLDENEVPIKLPQGTIEINSLGDVSVDGVAVAKIGVFDGQVEKIGLGLFKGVAMQEVSEPSLLPGAIEGSNVNAIEEMIEMIRLNRIYEMAQKSVQSHDEITQKLIQSAQNR